MRIILMLMLFSASKALNPDFIDGLFAFSIQPSAFGRFCLATFIFFYTKLAFGYEEGISPERSDLFRLLHVVNPDIHILHGRGSIMRRKVR